MVEKKLMNPQKKGSRHKKRIFFSKTVGYVFLSCVDLGHIEFCAVWLGKIT